MDMGRYVQTDNQWMRKMRREDLTAGRAANPEFLQSAPERTGCQSQLFCGPAGSLNAPIEQSERLENVAALFVLQGSSRMWFGGYAHTHHGRINT